MILAHEFDGIRVSFLDDSQHVLIVELNRPMKRNAMNWEFWRDYPKVNSRWHVFYTLHPTYPHEVDDLISNHTTFDHR